MTRLLLALNYMRACDQAGGVQIVGAPLPFRGQLQSLIPCDYRSPEFCYRLYASL